MEGSEDCEEKVEFIICVSVYCQCDNADRLWRLREIRREESI